jgi:hypothetical protein
MGAGHQSEACSSLDEVKSDERSKKATCIEHSLYNTEDPQCITPSRLSVSLLSNLNFTDDVSVRTVPATNYNMTIVAS